MLSGLLLVVTITFFLVLLPQGLAPTQLVRLSVGGSVAAFLYTLVLWLFFDPTTAQFQYLNCFYFIESYLLCFGIDFFSLGFLLLTTFLFPFCFLSIPYAVRKNVRAFVLLFISLEAFLIIIFISLDFFMFYLFFETTLIPMFFLIGWWGSGIRRTKAAFYFFFFTLTGSLLLLLALISLFFQTGSLSFFSLLAHQVSFDRQLVLWPCLFIAFAVKIPMFPFHIWLPEAHVEAPTAASVLLAGVLLKLGGYGMLRFLLPFFPLATFYYMPFIQVLAVLGSFYAAFVALRQIDLKRIVAYSSIAHMNVAIFGLFSATAEGIGGSFIIMLGHGLVSSALFFLVGVLYDRYKSRVLFYYSGLVLRMPLFAVFFFFFAIANIAFPGTVNFSGELLVLLGLLHLNPFFFVLILISLFFTTVFTMLMYNRVAFGMPRLAFTGVLYDLVRWEFVLFAALFLPTLYLGLYPQLILQNVQPTLYTLLMI